MICHHTAESASSYPAGGLRVVTYGRTGLPGPIANYYLSRDAVVFDRAFATHDSTPPSHFSLFTGFARGIGGSLDHPDQAEVHVEGSTLAEVLDSLDAAHPGFRDRLFDEQGALRRFVNVFVADDDVRYALAYAYFRTGELELAEAQPAARERHVGRHLGPLPVAEGERDLDPPLVAASCERRVHPMAKRELFELPLIGWYFWVYGAFPVRRFSGDMGALRVARSYLRTGEIVLMFPEGTRSTTGQIGSFFRGAFVIAAKHKVPLVPMVVEGTGDILPKGTFCIRPRQTWVRILPPIVRRLSTNTGKVSAI